MAYRRHFEGYSEFFDEQGHIQRVYTAEWICSPLSRAARMRRAFTYFILLAVSAALWGIASVAPAAKSAPVYFSALIAAGIPPLFFSAVSLFRLFAAPEKMTRSAYRDGPVRLKWAALASSICFAAAFIAAFFHTLFHSAITFSSVIWSVMYLISSILAGAVFLAEKRIHYQYLPNENTALAEQDSVIEIDI